MSSITAVFSGPKRTRKIAELVLQESGYEPLHAKHENAHALMDWARKFPAEKKTTEWITVTTENVNVPHALVAEHGWVLRMHYPTPDRPEPTPEQKLTATIAEMQARIAQLEGRVA